MLTIHTLYPLFLAPILDPIHQILRLGVNEYYKLTSNPETHSATHSACSLLGCSRHMNSILSVLTSDRNRPGYGHKERSTCHGERSVGGTDLGFGPWTFPGIIATWSENQLFGMRMPEDFMVHAIHFHDHSKQCR